MHYEMQFNVDLPMLIRLSWWTKSKSETPACKLELLQLKYWIEVHLFEIKKCLEDSMPPFIEAFLIQSHSDHTGHI